MTDAKSPLVCNRCSTQLVPGAGNFYVVRIEAVADPFPPLIDERVSASDLAAEIHRLIERTRNRSEQELLDQVDRRVTMSLCLRCYRQWIENPAG